MGGLLDAAPGSIGSHLLQPFCGLKRFAPGDVLREKGQHYKDMYLITDGRVAVNLEAGGKSDNVILGGGSPVGEISFLRGCPATATVVARTATEAIVIDDAALARLEREQPALAAQLLRHLAETAEERVSYNLTFASQAGAFTNLNSVDVYLCRNEAMSESAKRLRYEVYCEELGRNSPYADHEKRIITDDLDKFAHTFIAVEDGETTGTIRGNISLEGPLGAVVELYGMKSSPHHPRGTCVVTKFIVKKSKRGGPASFKLIAALTRFGLRNQMKECYIDSVPSLMPYYKAIGFKVVAPKFFHRENGPSYPMLLDLAKYGEALCRETTTRSQIKLHLKAQAFRLIDRIRRHRPFSRRRGP
jgi:predicted GNAT family N-acyltransferase